MQRPNVDTEVLGVDLGQFGEPYPEGIQVRAIDLLVQVLGQHVHLLTWTYSVLPLMGGGLTAIALAFRAPKTPAAFAAGVGLTLLVTILLSNQAFINYYFLVIGPPLISLVAWPTQPEPVTPVAGNGA